MLVCIECSGIHREMGVHISRIRSLTLDKLGTSELLVGSQNLFHFDTLNLIFGKVMVAMNIEMSESQKATSIEYYITEE